MSGLLIDLKTIPYQVSQHGRRIDVTLPRVAPYRKIEVVSPTTRVAKSFFLVRSDGGQSIYISRIGIEFVINHTKPN